MSKCILYSPVINSIHEEIYSKICSCIRQGKRVIYIAPSRELIFKVRQSITDMMGGLMNIDVMSFDDLEMEILKEKGVPQFAADANALTLILSELFEKMKLEGKAPFFTRVLDKQGFCEECLRTIRNIKRSMVSLDELKAMSGQAGLGQELSDKLEDVCTIYEEYTGRLDKLHLKDPEDVACKAASLAGDSAVFSSMGLMVIDGFFDIDGINRELLKNIIKAFPKADYVCSLPFRTDASEELLSSQIIGDLKAMDFELLEREGTGQRCVLAKLFSSAEALQEDASGIHISSHPCIEDEVRCMARGIKQLVLSGERADRIAVVITNDGDYRDAVGEIFSELGISLDMGGRVPLSSQPIARDLWALFSLKINGMGLQGLLGVIASRYFGLVEPGFQKQVQNALSRLYSGDTTLDSIEMAAKDPEKQGFTFEQLSKAGEAYRKTLELLKRLPENSNMENLADSLSDLLDSLHIREKLAKSYKSKLISSELFIRDVKAQFSIMQSISDVKELYRIAGADKKPMDFKEFTLIMADVLAKKTITTLQRSGDGVKALKPDVFRGVDYDYVFFLGLNEGVYPQPCSKGGLFTSRERELLAERKLDLGCGSLQLSRSKLAFLLCCCSAKKGLYLSYRSTGEDGSYMIKSPFLEELEGLYTTDAIKKATQAKRCMRQRFEADPDLIWSTREALDGIIIDRYQSRSKSYSLEPFERVLKLKGMDSKLKDIEYLGHIEESRQESEVFDRYDGLIKGTRSEQALPDYHFSASQINSYAKCPFKYYMERLLGISAYEDDGTLNAISEGSFYHQVLKYYYDNTKDIYNLDSPLLDKAIEDGLRGIIQGNTNKVVFDTKLNEMKELITSFINSDISFLKKYKETTNLELRPVYLEFKVEERDAFSPYLFNANIDRVDLEYNDNKPTGRFIMYDYKKKNGHGIKECLMGQDFQLAVYYQCIQKELKRRLGEVPAQCMGLVYYTIEDQDRDGLLREDCKKSLGKARKKDTLSYENFPVVMDFLRDKIKELCSGITAGDFTLGDICPLSGIGLGCEFSQVCRYDRYRIRGKRR